MTAISELLVLCTRVVQNTHIAAQLTHVPYCDVSKLSTLAVF